MSIRWKWSFFLTSCLLAGLLSADGSCASPRPPGLRNQQGAADTGYFTEESVARTEVCRGALVSVNLPRTLQLEVASPRLARSPGCCGQVPLRGLRQRTTSVGQDAKSQADARGTATCPPAACSCFHPTSMSFTLGSLAGRRISCQYIESAQDSYKRAGAGVD